MKTFEPNKYATELGIDKSRKFVMVNTGCNFPKGSILTLICDDDLQYTTFTDQNGETGRTHWCNLAYAEEQPRKFKEGDMVKITDYNNHEGGQWIMDNGIWFNENQLENINKLSKD